MIDDYKARWGVEAYCPCRIAALIYDLTICGLERSLMLSSLYTVSLSFIILKLDLCDLPASARVHLICVSTRVEREGVVGNLLLTLHQVLCTRSSAITRAPHTQWIFSFVIYAPTGWNCVCVCCVFNRQIKEVLLCMCAYFSRPFCM